MSKVFKLYTGEAAITKAITALAPRGMKYQAEMHKTACSVLAHVYEHKDVRLINKLIEAMPEMARKNAMKYWFDYYGPVTFDAKGAIYVKTKPHNRLGAAIEKPFFKFKPEPDYEPIDGYKAIESLIKRFEKDTLKTERNWSQVVTALKCLKVTNEPTPLPEPVIDLPAASLIAAVQADVQPATVQ